MRPELANFSPMRAFGVLTSSMPSSMTLIVYSLVLFVEPDDEPYPLEDLVNWSSFIYEFLIDANSFFSSSRVYKIPIDYKD